MGVFTYKVLNLADGESGIIPKPAGAGRLMKLYATSTNLTHYNVTAARVNTLPKSANTNYNEGLFPLSQASPSEGLDVTVYTGAVAEDITFIAEWI